MSDQVITPGAEAAPAVSAPAAPSPADTGSQAPNVDGLIQQQQAQQQAPAAQAEPELFDLPDGRKVDAATLANEWKTNFMPDYTQKSQKLSEIQKQFGGQNPTQQQSINQPSVPSQQQQAPWQNPEWIPQSYAEIVEAAAQKMQLDQYAQQQQQQELKQQANQLVENQLGEIRKMEPNLSEELLFQHAVKYGFGDLKQAFQNMRDFNLAVQKTAAQTTKNIQQRAADPIGGKPGTPDASTGIDYRQISQGNLSAVEFLQKLQGR